MQTITHTITDELGLHARPAGKIVKMAGKFAGKVQIGTPDKMVDCKRIMGVMGLALKQGDTVTMTFDGEGEEQLAKEIEEYMKAEL